MHGPAKVALERPTMKLNRPVLRKTATVAGQQPVVTVNAKSKPSVESEGRARDCFGIPDPILSLESGLPILVTASAGCVRSKSGICRKVPAEPARNVATRIAAWRNSHRQSPSAEHSHTEQNEGTSNRTNSTKIGKLEGEKKPRGRKPKLKGVLSYGTTTHYRAPRISHPSNEILGALLHKSLRTWKMRREDG